MKQLADWSEVKLGDPIFYRGKYPYVYMGYFRLPGDVSRHHHGLWMRYKKEGLEVAVMPLVEHVERWYLSDKYQWNEG